MSTQRGVTTTTIICGFRKTKRDHYCDYSVAMVNQVTAMAHFAEHCLAKHKGKMTGEIIVETPIATKSAPINGHAD